MKKRLRDYKVNSLKKKTISLVTASAMLMGSLPASGLSSLIGKMTALFNSPISASAEPNYYDRADYTKKDSTGTYYLIESWDDLVWYSQAYYNFANGKEGVANHQNDELYFKIIDEDANTHNLGNDQYEPIGNSAFPFKGKIRFANGSPDTFNISGSLFGNISEKVKILNQDETAEKQITLTRTGMGFGEVMFANIVESDNNNETKAKWNILLKEYSSSANTSYAGIIGEIADGANVELTLTHNALSGKSIIEKSTDVGLLCGKIGDGASLEATITTDSSSSGFTIESSNGNAGGLVGQMCKGSILTVTSDNLQGSKDLFAANGYAGGIVGKNVGGTVSVTPETSGAKYSIQQFIHGKNGSGGLFGYYAPNKGAQEIDVSNYNVNCTINLSAADSGYAGGLIGKLENKALEGETTGSNLTIKGVSTTSGSTTTIDTSVTSSHNFRTETTGAVTGSAAKAYGGLIGSYTASDTSYSLTIKDIKAVPDNSLSSPLYGGAIGEIDDASYVKFENFTLVSAAAAAQSNMFGGLCADAEGAYVYAKDVTIGTTAISGFNGGGLIGALGNGVLGMTGNINVSKASPSVDKDTNGQLVGTSDHALVYAEGTWTFTPSSVELDNIGSWGDVLVFDGTKLKRSDVFASETNHVITLNTVTTTNIDSVADFAVASVLFQIDPTQNPFLSDTTTQLAEDVTIVFTNDIDLTGTSLRGITRDNTTTRSSFKGDASSTAGKKITLDIKNVGEVTSGTARPVFRHRYLGLFGIAEGGTYSDISLDGVILSKNGRKTESNTSAYVGALAGQAKTSITVSNCKTLATSSDSLKIVMNGDVSTIGGRLIGEAVQAKSGNTVTSMGNISISTSTFDGTITGNVNSIVGGVIGKIADAKSGAIWKFEDVTIKGTVTGVKNVGGLVSDISGGGTATLKLQGSNSGNGVVIDGLNVTGNSNDSSGGLLGYLWSKTDAEITKVSIKNNPSVTQSNTGGTAGLVYKATGHWTVTDLNLSGIKVSAANAGSVGIIVNKGIDSNDGIFLELPQGYIYTLSFADDTNVSKSVTNNQFDEICAFSASNAANIMNNGQGIVSISTYDGSNNSSYKLKMGSTGNPDTTNTGITYQAQTTQGATKNPNVRYYYNLDKIKTGNTLTAAPEKMLGWGVYTYAATNIQKHFNNSKDFAFSASDNYDMRGYSWYPITLSSTKATTVAGSFTLYNEEFTETEGAKAAVNSITNRWKPLESDQHYMMQNAIFYDVNSSLTIGNTTLSGTIGAINNTNGTGALIYGNVKGTSKATTSISTTGTISLAGIRVWNLNTYLSYAPLLINKASDYVTFDIKNVSTTADYKRTTTGESPDTTTIDAATSLIGKAGTRDTATEDTPISQGITVNFSAIKLDGRKTETVSAYDSTPDRYNTTKSIFTRATLLEQLVGSNGIYNYTFDEDWGTGTPHTVTYGKEVGYTTQGQYPNQELWYKDEKATGGKSRYTHPDTAPADSDSTQYTGFGPFLPYVANVNTKAEIDAKTGFKYQLMVNHQPSDKIAGCGTYNDPYIISSAKDLVNISLFINSSANLNGKINIDVDNDGWCDSTTVGETTTLYTEHVEYTLNGTSAATCSGQSNITADNMRKYLASAYYQIRLSGATQLELSASSGFLGLGTASIPFSGVIDGGQSSTTTIVNKTQFPLINYSGGCVVRNISVTVDATVTLDEATDSYDYITGNKTHGAYGAIIAVANGGDNIIDNTQVTFGGTAESPVKINAKGKKAQFQPIGGYVGVVVDGGIIFRNMTSGNISGITNSNVSAVKGGSNPDINNYSQSTHAVKMTDSDNLLWLYVNPIIGRVINGYAVNIASAYHTAYSDCVMKNGNKNYSITDINLSGGSLTISESNLTIPNGQALFLTSVIVNSGMGATKRGYTTDFIKRTAAYDKVGSDAASSSLCPDFDTYAKNDTTSGTAYIIKNFAAGGDTLGSGGPWNITLTSGGSFVLPDGFRGIGNFYQNDTNLLLNVSDFNGNGVTITENILFYTYDDGSGNFDNTYYPNISAEGETTFCSTTDAGIGLFTKQPQVGGNYYNFKLSGKIKSDVINHKTGVHIDYTGNTSTEKVGGGNVDQKQVLSAGMLFGNFSGAGAKKVRNATPTHITNVALVNVDVSAAKMAGGMIGIVPIGGNGNDARYVNLEIEINSSTYNSSGIKVHGGLSAAGLLARYQQGTCNINFNGNSFEIDEIVSDTKSNTDSYYYGVGGIIGTLRADRESPATPVTIKNVTLGDENATKAIEVKCSESGCGINAGGLIGSLNRASATMDNCHVFNVSVSSNGSSTHVGGAFGHMRTQCDVTVKDSSIESNDTAKASISGNGYVGGFLGNSPNNKDKARIFTVEKSRIKGYTISGDTSGGIVGERDAIDATYYLKVSDFSIENCIIKGDTYAGGLIGHLSKPLNGYNILAKDLTFESHTEGGTIKNLGYLVAKNDSVVKLVGFSRQADSSSTMVQAMTGGSNATNYGNGGYVIFADYMGTASYDNTSFTPGTNSSATFSNMYSNTNVSPYAPYVTTSPITNIANKDSEMKFVLGDGASPLTNADVGKSTEAFAKIQSDIANLENGYYANVKDYLDSDDEYKAFTTKISSFKTEMGSTKPLADGIDFPVLIVDNVDNAQLTDFLNKYIRSLTNTPSTFNYTVDVNDSSAKIYKVEIRKVAFNSAGTAIDSISSSSNTNHCLKRANNQFYMTASDTDTAAATAQFTLVDVQFFNPSKTSEIAYHLYIPCYVRKLLEYDFDVHIESGTNYKINSYDQLVENALVENIGTPVTLEFAFTYNRSASEWGAAINAGDSVLTNYAKNLLFDNSTHVESGQSKPVLPSSTKMVLVDTQNNSKAYYLDSLTNDAFNGSGDQKTLHFNQFKDLANSYFTPVDFNDMINVSITPSSSGTLVEDDNQSTVKDTSTGTKYRPATDSEKNNSSIQKYTASVSFKNGEEKISEHYFLTIYTPYVKNDIVYHYTIKANNTLGNTPYPSRVTSESETHAANLIIGDIYDNNIYIDSLKVGGVENAQEISNSNNEIEANIRAMIGLTSSGEKNVRSYLSGTSVPDIYQSMLIKLNKGGTLGIAAVTSVDVSDYMIGGKLVTDSTCNPMWTNEEYTETNPNYIELRNGVSLASKLANTSVGGKLTISAKATLSFSTEDIINQFYPESSSSRTTLFAYSNIASSFSQTSSSKVSSETNLVRVDTTTAGTTPQYYRSVEEKATLNYEALDIVDKGSLSQLGINANDPKDSKNLPSLIKTVASYNVENCQNAWDSANYVKIEIELRSKNDNYNTALTIFDYLQESSFKIFDSSINVDSTTGTTSNKLVYIINKSKLNKYYQDKVYNIPIEFKVFSGSGAANRFESENRRYSNYGIIINVSMLANVDSTSSVTGTTHDPENNYVKYTNARIYLDKLNAAKASA